MIKLVESSNANLLIEQRTDICTRTVTRYVSLIILIVYLYYIFKGNNSIHIAYHCCFLFNPLKILFQPTDVILPSGKQYQLQYDEHGNLHQLIMPSLSRHQFTSLTSLGVHRLIYWAPDSRAPYVQESNGVGQVMQVLNSLHTGAPYLFNSLGLYFHISLSNRILFYGVTLKVINKLDI